MEEKSDRAGWRDIWQETREAERVDRNILMLNNEMQELLMSESVGGNAGHIKIEGEFFPQAVANGLIDVETGEIIAFGNPQDIKDKKNANAEEFAFAVAVDDSRQYGFFKITFCRKNDSLFSEQALRVLAKTIERYNHEQKEKNNVDLITTAKDFDELYVALKKIGSLLGSKQSYDAEKLIELINAARQKPDSVNLMRITKAFGLRDKVLTLLRQNSAVKVLL